MPAIESNFHFVEAHDGQLYRLGMLAEKYFRDDPNTCLIKLRQLAELAAKLAAGRFGLTVTPADGFSDVLRRLRFECSLPREVGDLFHGLRVLCMRAAQDGMDEDDDSFHDRQLPACYVRTSHDAALKLGHLNYVRQATDEKQ